MNVQNPINVVLTPMPDPEAALATCDGQSEWRQKLRELMREAARRNMFLSGSLAASIRGDVSLQDALEMAVVYSTFELDRLTRHVIATSLENFDQNQPKTPNKGGQP